MNSPAIESSSAQTTPSLCPNPRCNGVLSPGQESCPLCSHELGACPGCGSLMSKTLGRCGRCGFRHIVTAAPTSQAIDAVPSSVPDAAAESPSALRPAVSAPAVLRFETSRDSVRSILSGVYAQAVLADAEMVAATQVLEKVRTSLLTEPDALKTWRKLDEQIGAADANSLRPALMALRTWFKQQLCEQHLRRLRELFGRNPETGWREWLRTYATALVTWRLGLCRALVEADFPFPDEFRQPLDFRRRTRWILQSRWPEVYRFFSQLAHQDFLHPQVRAQLLVFAGQVHLYFFSPKEPALTFFQQAQQLAPGLGRVLAALGDYHKDTGDFNTARSYLRQALEADPGGVDGYACLGELAEKQGQFEEARSWYQQAIKNAGDDSLGYSRLLRLYGRPEFLEKLESQIQPLVEGITAIDETGGYNACLDAGDAYLVTKRFASVHQWYDQAIESEPDRMEGYCRKGFAWLEEGPHRFEAAREAFRQAIKVAPESYNGHWAMGQLCERQNQWAAAAEWYAQAAQRQPELQAAMLTRIGEMRCKLEQYDGAETVLLSALQLDPANDAVVLGLAEEYCEKLGRAEDALRLYERIRDVKGESFEASYQNRVGNVFYHESQYDRAIEHYHKAIASDPTRPVFYSNLAGAHKELKQWETAREQYRKALEFTGDQAKYASEMAGTYNLEGNEFYARQQYQEAAGCYTEAIRFMPATPRYPSNRALALEPSMRTSENPGELLERALADARTALQLAQSTKDLAAQVLEYTEQVASLEKRKIFLDRYGRFALALKPVYDSIRLELRSGDLPLVLNPNSNELTREFLERISQMREAIFQHYGVKVPGLIIGELGPANDRSRSDPQPARILELILDGLGSVNDRIWDYQVVIRGEAIAFGWLLEDRKFALGSPSQLAEWGLTGAGPLLWPRQNELLQGCWLNEPEWPKAVNQGAELIDPLEFLVRHVQSVISLHLPQLCGFDLVMNLLAQCDSSECADIRSDPRQVIRLTQTLKDRLRHDQPVPEFAALCRDASQPPLAEQPGTVQPPTPSTPAPQPPAIDPGIVALSLRCHPHSTLDRAQMAEVFAGLQALLFDELGIVIPQIAFVDDEAVGENDFQLEINSEKLPITPGLAPDEVWILVPWANMKNRFPEGRSSVEPNTGDPAAILKASPAVSAEAAVHRYTMRPPFEYFISCLASELRRQAERLLTTDTVEYYLVQLKSDHPSLVKLVLAFFSLEELTQRLRNSLSRKKSIRNLPRKLETLLLPEDGFHPESSR